MSDLAASSYLAKGAKAKNDASSDAFRVSMRYQYGRLLLPMFLGELVKNLFQFRLVNSLDCFSGREPFTGSLASFGPVGPQSRAPQWMDVDLVRQNLAGILVQLFVAIIGYIALRGFA
jgi:hypothetical protein